MSRQEAKKLIEKTDKHRGSFYSYYTNENWREAANYQLSIDSGNLGITQTAELIIDYIERKNAAESL